MSRPKTPGERVVIRQPAHPHNGEYGTLVRKLRSWRRPDATDEVQLADGTVVRAIVRRAA